jgi:hypothetical protein
VKLHDFATFVPILAEAHARRLAGGSRVLYFLGDKETGSRWAVLAAPSPRHAFSLIRRCIASGDVAASEQDMTPYADTGKGYTETRPVPGSAVIVSKVSP